MGDADLSRFSPLGCNSLLKKVTIAPAMKYAVVRIGSRQFKVKEGQNLTVDRFDGKISDVLLCVDGDKVSVGEPLVKAAKIKARVLGEGQKKTEIRRFKAKSRYRKKTGHKQPVTKLLIERIEVE